MNDTRDAFLGGIFAGILCALALGAVLAFFGEDVLGRWLGVYGPDAVVWGVQ